MATDEEKEEVFEFSEDALDDAVANAPEAGFVNVNFGRLTVLPYIVSWGKKDPTTGKSPKLSRPMKPGDKVKEGEYTEIKFRVDIAEFNPALNFSYERAVPVRKSSSRAQSDWSEIVEPGLISVLGPKWIAAAKGRPYVAVEDTPNINGKANDKGKIFGVPKVVAVYANAAECAAARELRFSGAGGNHADAELTALVDQVRGLLSAVGDVDEVRKLLAQPPFGNHDADKLLALAQL